MLIYFLICKFKKKSFLRKKWGEGGAPYATGPICRAFADPELFKFPVGGLRIILITLSTKGSDAILGKKICECIRYQSPNKR